MDIEKARGEYLTLEDLRALYLPELKDTGNLRTELADLIPFSETEIEDFLDGDSDQQVLRDAYVTSRYIRSHLRDVSSLDELRRVVTKPAEAYGGRTLVELFRDRDFRLLVDRWERTFSWEALG